MQINSETMQPSTPTRREKLAHYRREVCNTKQMTKIFVFLDKDWEDRGTGPVYFILRSEDKYHKLNDYDLDRLYFNWEQYNRRQQQHDIEERDKPQDKEQVVKGNNHVVGKNLAVLSSNLDNETNVVINNSQEEANKNGLYENQDFMNNMEYSLKIQSEPEDKLYEAYLSSDKNKDLVEESGLVYYEPNLNEEISMLNKIGLGITFESQQVKPRTGELFILILKSDDTNLPKRPDNDLNEILKGEFRDNEEILMWYNLGQIYTMDAPYNNIIEWQHESKDKLKLAISFLSYPRCEESYHAIIRNVGIQGEELLSPIEPGCDLNKKLINMKSDTVELDSIKTAYMNTGSRYMRGLHREFCMSMYYQCSKRLKELGEIFKFFVFLSDMDIMTNMISDENHLMFFTCLNYLDENKDKNLNFEEFFREKAAMINVLNIKKEEIIVVINNRFRLIFLKDFVFSVSLSEEILQHYNIFLIMNGTTVISYLIESMDILFANLDELIHRNVDQMTNFFGEFFGTIKHHFLQFEELKAKFSTQMVELGMWKTLSVLILKNLHYVEKLQLYLDSVVALESIKPPVSERNINKPINIEMYKKDKAKPENVSKPSISVQNDLPPMNLGSSYVSVVSEVKSVRGEDKLEVDISRSVVAERRRSRVNRMKYRDRNYLENSLKKTRKKVLLCLEVLSFIIKHNKTSATQIFFEPVYKKKCLADGIYELASFPFLSVRETFAEIFNFFIHYMDNKESFVHFLFHRLYPHVQNILFYHKHKFEYFEENGLMKFLNDQRTKELQKNQISAIKKDQLQSQEPYQQKNIMKKKSEVSIQDFNKDWSKHLKYRQYSEGNSLSNKKINMFKDKEMAESAMSQEDFDPKSLKIEESILSEYKSDFESLKKRGHMDRNMERMERTNGVKENRRFQREKHNFERFLTFYLGLHDVMDKVGSNELSYWERKENLFRDCRLGFFKLNKKNIQVYFLKVLHEAVNKETFNASEKLFDEQLFEKLILLVNHNIRNNSMISCILKGIFAELRRPAFKNIQKTLVSVYDRMIKEQTPKKIRIWRPISKMISDVRKELEAFANQQLNLQEYASNSGQGGINEIDHGRQRLISGGIDSFAKGVTGGIGSKNIKLVDSLIDSAYDDNMNSSDEDDNRGMRINDDKGINKQLFKNQVNNNGVDDPKDEGNWKNSSDELVLKNKKEIKTMVQNANLEISDNEKNPPEQVIQLKLN